MFEGEEKKSKIDSVKDVLYSRNTDGIFAKKRHGISPADMRTEAPAAWQDDVKAESRFRLTYPQILFGAFVFFALAVAFAAYTFLAGSNTVSANNIGIAVNGPVSVAGGEVLPLDITVTNNNQTVLNTVDLRIEYPSGTKTADASSKDLPRESLLIGDMPVGKSQERLVKAVLFGQENTQETVKITVEYRIPGSNAVFSKEKDYTVLLSSSPVTLTIAGDNQVNAGQQTQMTIKIKSNTLSALTNLILKADYPFGFDFVSANTKPANLDQSVFTIGDLAPGQERTIIITGMINGQDGEERVLKFTVGTPKSTDKNTIDTPLALAMDDITIQKASVSLTMLVNQSADDSVPISAGDKITANLTWQNNLPEKIYNVSVVTKLSGQILDKTQVGVDNGFYSSKDNTITFDKTTLGDLETLAPSDQGTANFTLATLLPSVATNVQFANAAITMTTTITGSRTSGGNSSELLYSGKKTLKLSSGLGLLSRSFRTIGPFENSGPFPPKVDQETTYTVTWTASDSFNNTNNVSVAATLPPNVKWAGFTSPTTENVSYNDATRQVLWTIGAMQSGTGTTYPPKEVSFQVSVTPSITQLGFDVPLVNAATITGTDSYSGETLSENRPAVTTDVVNDPQYVPGIGKVGR